MIDGLRGHWPVIEQHPWDFLWVFAIGLSAGWAASALWRKLTSEKQPAPRQPGAVAKLLKRVTERKFKPTGIQRNCVQGLRFHDHRHLTVEQLSQVMQNKYPVSDVKQALEQLDEQGWVHWQISEETFMPAYTLQGKGLDYAREMNFQVRAP